MARIPPLLRQWNAELRERLEAVWRSRWAGVELTSAATFVVACLLYWIPIPGVSVAVMGVVAATMSLRTRATGAEKAAWMLIISSLLVIEVTAIRKDRWEQTVSDAIRAREERQHFGEIGQGIQGTLKQTEQQFEATMSKENTVLDTTQSVASLSQRNLDTVTGKDSYPCIVPQSHAVTRNGVLPLVVWDKGPNVLTGVEVRLMSQAEISEWRSFLQATSRTRNNAP